MGPGGLLLAYEGQQLPRILKVSLLPVRGKGFPGPLLWEGRVAVIRVEKFCYQKSLIHAPYSIYSGGVLSRASRPWEPPRKTHTAVAIVSQVGWANPPAE